MTAAIEVRELSKTFYPAQGLFSAKRKSIHRPVDALKNISFKVNLGESIAIIGANGAGKTTLIKTLCTLVLPTRGQAAIAGFDLERDSKKVREQISLVLCEERSFYWRLTGRQNLDFFASLYGLRGKAKQNKISSCAEIFNLKNLDQRYQEYSTGTKQRLALARTFLSNTSILFMDEPTRSLDPVASQELRELIQSRFQDKTVFFSTHNLAEATELSDKIAIMDQGELKGFGTLNELQNRFKLANANLEEIFNKIRNEVLV